MASSGRPAKRTRLMSGSESSSDETELERKQNGGLRINEEYARRFEHNKKREEKDRLEEKYGKSSSNGVGMHGDTLDDDDEEDSSEDESEDDDAELATKDLDAEIEETLAAIKRKDPRVYDKEIHFYRDYDPEGPNEQSSKKEKPMSLHDYHRRNLMEGFTGDDPTQDDVRAPKTYAQEQEDLKRTLVGDMHATATNGEMSEDGDEDFLVAKRKPNRNELLSKMPSKEITNADVAAADQDPENYLSNFMAARAWLPTARSQWTAFESDASDDEKRADEFEEAYNLRFEDPEHANEKLKTFSREAGKYSVRRDETKGGARKRARELEKEKKDAERRERQEERKRLRDLRVEETAEKVKKIREAAGLRGEEVDVDEWKDVLEGDFDDGRWEEEMRRRFGEAYYAEEEEARLSADGQEHGARASKKRKLLKPTWDTDIDINDLVPEFEQEDVEKPAFTLSSDDEAEDEDGGVPVTAEDIEDGDGESPVGKTKAKRRSKKEFAKEKADARRAARIERRKIEDMVDANLPLEHPSLSASTPSRPPVAFRYRETSPTNFGMTARDILFADDAQLNQYAGLKKMAAFRDDDKKRRDKKRYSKKGRLREWRKEVFGVRDEPSGGFERVLGDASGNAKMEGDEIRAEGKKKRKRSKGKKVLA